MHKLLARIAAVFLLALPLFAAAVGSTHRYTYDAAGNIVAIKNVAADALAFTSFSPTKAAFLAQVTLSGSGFSLVTTENVVSFNGTLANVVSASANTLVVTVPTNARTGRITVSIGSAFITNPTIFVVDTSLQAPTITSFSPATVTTGNVVTLTGTNYDPVASNNSLTFNSQLIPISNPSPTHISGTVSTAATSGKIAVTTSYGTAVSATDLIVVPSGHVATDIGKTARTTIGATPLAVSIPAAKLGMVLFDGVQEENVSLGITSVVTAPGGAQISVSLIAPDGTTLSTCYGLPPSFSCYLSTLPSTGTYTLLFTTTSASSAFKVSLSKEITSALTTSTQTLSFARAAQSERLTFIANQASAYTVKVSGIVLNPVTATLNASLIDPSGYGIQGVGTSSGGMVFHLPSARLHGTYTLFFQPDSGATGSAHIALDAGVPLVLDGAAASINTTVLGQSAKYYFAATAGQNLGLALTGLTLTAPSYGATVLMFNPDGSVHSNFTNSCPTIAVVPSGCSWSLLNLPQSGTYTVLVMPGSYGGVPARVDNSLMTASLTLSSDVSAALPSSTSTAVNLTRAGQKERLSFSATVGQPIDIEVSGITTTPTGQGFTGTVIDPNGNVIQSFNNRGDTPAGGLVLFVPKANVTGTYTLLLEPNGGALGAATVTLDPGTPLSLNGAAVNVQTNSIGLAKRFNFSASAGQNVGLSLAALNVAPASFNVASVLLYNPDGTPNNNINYHLFSNTACNSTVIVPNGCGWDLVNLPQTGSYTLLLIPGFADVTPIRTDASTMSASITVTSDLSSALTAGAPVSITLAAGQNERLSFTATPGQPIVVELAGVSTTTPTGAGFYATILDPTGTILTQGQTGGAGGLVLYANAGSASGPYALLVEPQGGAGGSAQVTLDAGATLPLDGAAANINTNAAGQSLRFNFSATQGQNLGLALSGMTLLPASFNMSGILLYNPDGTRNANINYHVYSNTLCPTVDSNPNGCGWDLANLPQTGVYTLLVMPVYVGDGPSATDPATMTATVTVSTDLTPTLTTTAPVTVNPRAGQNARLNFAGVAGQPIAIEVAGIVTTPAYAGFTGTILDPNGAFVTGLSCSGTNGLVLYVPSASVSGTYTLLLEPNGGAGGSAQVTLDAGLPLVLDGSAASVNTSISGQALRFNFSAAQGQNLGLAMSGLTLTPESFTSAGLLLFNPDGTSNSAINWRPDDNTGCTSVASNSSGCSWNLVNLPQTGTYTLLVIPGIPSGTPSRSEGSTMIANLTLSTDQSIPLTATTPLSVSLRAGQNARVSFTAAAGQPIDIEVAGVTTLPASAGLTGTILDPSGIVVTQLTNYGNGGLLLYVPNATVGGSYTLLLQPNGGSSGSALVTLDPGIVLPTNGSVVSVNTATVAQGLRFKFAATQNQSLTLALMGLTLTPSTTTTAGVLLYNPDGSANSNINWRPFDNTGCTSIASNPNGCTWSLTSLPQTGTYTLLLIPGIVVTTPSSADAVTMQATVTLQ